MAANFSLCLLSAILMRIGLAAGWFQSGGVSTSEIVLAPQGSGEIAAGIAAVLSIFFSLNLLLGCFNLIPFPPLDGYGVQGLFMNEAGALRLEELRVKIRGLAIIGLLIAWRVLDQVYEPLLVLGVRGVYFGHPIS